MSSMRHDGISGFVVRERENRVCRLQSLTRPPPCNVPHTRAPMSSKSQSQQGIGSLGTISTDVSSLMLAEVADAEKKGLDVYVADSPGSKVFFLTPPHLAVQKSSK